MATSKYVVYATAYDHRETYWRDPKYDKPGESTAGGGRRKTDTEVIKTTMNIRHARKFDSAEEAYKAASEHTRLLNWSVGVRPHQGDRKPGDKVFVERLDQGCELLELDRDLWKAKLNDDSLAWVTAEEVR